MRGRVAILLLLTCSALAGRAQSVNLDSLWSIWSDPTKENDIRYKALRDYAWEGHIFSNPDSGYYYGQLMVESADKQNLPAWKAEGWNIMGITKSIGGDHVGAMDLFKKARDISIETGDERHLSSALNNMGRIYSFQGDQKRAIDCFTKSLEIDERLGDKDGIITLLLNIGGLQADQGNHHHALEYYEDALELETELGLKREMGRTYNNIGTAYKNLKNPETARDYFNLSLQYKEEVGDIAGMAATYHNLGSLLTEQDQWAEAIPYYEKSIDIAEETGNQSHIPLSLANLGDCYLALDQPHEALKHGNEAFELAEKFGMPSELSHAAAVKYKAYHVLGDYKQAFDMLQLSVKMRDSVFNIQNREEQLKLKYRYDYEKKSTADSIKNAEAVKVEKAKVEAEKAHGRHLESEADRQRQQSYFLYGGLGLVLIFALFILNRFRVTNRQKQIIEEQKGQVDIAYDQLEEKNNEILDSIAYAKRIQEAILPPDPMIKKWLPNSFVLYKPKDIVAGDFYWMEVIQTNSHPEGGANTNSPPFQGAKAADTNSPPFQGGVPEGRGGQNDSTRIMNRPELKPFRKELRNNPTPAEAELWKFLRKSQLAGRKFRRQHSIANFIVDFYCPAEKLAVELDGEVHNDVAQAEYDHERDLILENYGIKVLRFENKLVFEQLDHVLEEIKSHFDHPDRAKRATTPPQGGGEHVVYLAAADCTGHGVPGAMVSVVCSNALTKALIEEGVREPAKILDRTRELVIERFKRSEQEVKDGMDISLVAMDLETGVVRWAGAYNPLWILKKGSSKIEEIKADKQPIGQHASATPFTGHEIQLTSGDRIYMFTDGFADQFGGEKGKKYKSGNLKMALAGLKEKSMPEQLAALDEEFEQWRGDLEQIDDVCVIGVQL